MNTEAKPDAEAGPGFRDGLTYGRASEMRPRILPGIYGIGYSKQFR